MSGTKKDKENEQQERSRWCENQSGRGFRLAVASHVRPRRCWTLTGADWWGPSICSLTIVPQHPYPQGGKHFLKNKEVHEPCCRLSWQQIIRPTSSPPVRPIMLPLLCSTSPGSNCPGRLEQNTEEQLLCSQFILPMFFPACHGSLCTFPALKENLLAHCCFLVAQERVWPHMTSQGDRCFDECTAPQHAVWIVVIKL